jgi:hypothetical protein
LTQTILVIQEKRFMYYMRLNMKRILIAVLVLISVQSFANDSIKGISFSSFWRYRSAPAVPYYTDINSQYRWLAGAFTRTLHVPSGGTAALGTNGWRAQGAVYYDSTGTDSGFYVLGSGGVFQRLANGSSAYTNLTQFVAQTNWRLFYSNGSGDVTELALGTSGQLLQANGTTSAPTWLTPTYVSTRDRFGLSGEDVTATGDRTFNIGSNIFKIDGADGDNYVRYNGYEFKHQSFESWDNDFSTIISNPSTFQAQAGRGSTYGQIDANTTYSAVEMLTPDGVSGLENRYEGGVAFSWLAAGNPYTGIYLDRHVGVRIGKGIATNDYNIRGLRIDTSRQIYMDSIDAGPGVYALRIDANGKVTYADTTSGGGGGYTNLTQFVAQTAWRIFYSDGSGDVQELALGDAGKVLTAAGATSVPTWETPISASSTTTFTNKRWTARVGSTASSATPAINTDNYDIFKITALAADITSMTSSLTGTPVDGDILEVQITGTATRAIAWGASFVSTTVALPTTTSSTTTLTVILQYYTTSSYGNNKWHCVNYY